MFVHTKPWALYNEIDDFAATWLEQLIAAGHIANGIVDRRSIVDILPDELRGFRQVHLFAGIGVWSYSFRRAGISDDTEAWSASCPCQPFSGAGKGEGVDDERHLWPHAHHLIRERRPRLIFGEQVASKDGLAWLDLVQADMEGTQYAFGAVDTCAAGFGAPHIRQRQYWFAERLADAESERQQSRAGPETSGSRFDELGFGDSGQYDRLDNDYDTRLEGFRSGHSSSIGHGQGSLRSAAATSELDGLAHDDQNGRSSSAFAELFDAPYHAEPRGSFERLADNSSERRIGREGLSTGGINDRPDAGRFKSHDGSFGVGQIGYGLGHNRGTGPTNGFWADVDWLHCRDAKWRPVEPGTFPLAHGAPAEWDDCAVMAMRLLPTKRSASSKRSSKARPSKSKRTDPMLDLLLKIYSDG